MTKRKPNARPDREDPAAKVRAKLEARRAAAQGARAPRWSPGVRDRLSLTFARLLYTATAPSTKSSGLRKRVLERWLLRPATQHAAHRKALYKAAKTVLNAARTRNPAAFARSRDELRRLWREARTGRRTGRRR